MAEQGVFVRMSRKEAKIVQAPLPAHLRYFRVIGVAIEENRQGYRVQVYGPLRHERILGMAMVRKP